MNYRRTTTLAMLSAVIAGAAPSISSAQVLCSRAMIFHSDLLGSTIAISRILIRRVHLSCMCATTSRITYRKKLAEKRVAKVTRFCA
jgi:hypothetical protein